MLELYYILSLFMAGFLTIELSQFYNGVDRPEIDGYSIFAFFILALVFWPLFYFYKYL